MACKRKVINVLLTSECSPEICVSLISKKKRDSRSKLFLSAFLVLDCSQFFNASSQQY